MYWSQQAESNRWPALYEGYYHSSVFKGLLSIIGVDHLPLIKHINSTPFKVCIDMLIHPHCHV